MRGAILLLAAAVAGCAPQLSFNNEAGGVINQTGSIGSDRAFALASEHCAKYGKDARITSQTSLPHRMRFDCVAK